MNTNKIKTYAPKARRDFIAAVTRRAGTFGLTAKGTAPVREEGQLVFIEGQPYPRSVGTQRRKLAARVKQHGFEQTMEAAAYTWFNRLIAIRFMELHGYLDHSFRVLSHPASQALPEVLGHAEHLDLPGLDRERVIELKMDGNRDEELYRDLLLAQCRALHRAMPFLFERVDDETELLLPDNLLQTDSLIRDLVGTIPEEDWQEVEIIGWLYQFYISEKKDQVIGKVVKSEDIPAATQLFTPNWIVQYLVQNSVGRLWLMANPASTLKGEWPYYIEPAEQTAEVQAQLDALIAARCREEGDRDKGIGDRGGDTASDAPLSRIPYPLSPETITVLDPACGSGHILVVAYDVLKAIYLERGYRPRDIPRLILEKNLYGLDIDDRAAQLAGFALLMKARADDRRLLDDPPKLNVLALQESKGLNADELTRSLQPIAAMVGRVSPEGVTRQPPLAFAQDDLFPGTLPQMSLGESVAPETSGYAALTRSTIAALIDTFAEAKTFGSLIQIPTTLAKALPEMEAALLQAVESGDVFARAAAEGLLPLVTQARVLAIRCDAVVANPPYMGTKGMNPLVKKFAVDGFPDAKNDLFGCFIERGYELAKETGQIAMVTMQSWMFLSSFEKMRKRMLGEKTLTTMVQIGYNSFPSMNSKVARATVFSLVNHRHKRFVSTFIDLNSAHQAADKDAVFLARDPSARFFVSADDFSKIPGRPLAYWASKQIVQSFSHPPLGNVFTTREGMATADNDRFLRYWSEVSYKEIRLQCASEEDAELSEGTWFPYNKGGEFRKWYGNNEFVVEYKYSGHSIKSHKDVTTGKLRSHNYNGEFGFREGLTWSAITSGPFSVRHSPQGYLFDSKGAKGFSLHHYEILALLNSCVARQYLSFLSPTLDFKVGDVVRIPMIIESLNDGVASRAREIMLFSKCDWDGYERSWDFQSIPILKTSHGPRETLAASYAKWIVKNRETIAQMKRIEEENNRLFIDAYSLQGELLPDVPIDQITLTVNPAYRYGGSLMEDEQSVRFCQDTMTELISYAIGCMMGRYRLDRPGLIYAHSGNQDFEAIYNAAREESTDDTDEHRLRNEHLCKSVSSVDNSSFPATDGITDAVREKSTDDTDEHRSRNEHLCKSVSSVDNSSFPAPGGITDATREESTDDTDEHRSRNEHLCPSVSSVDKNPFPADADGIVPITDANWFDDDAANRIREFLLAVWGTETLNENMAWLAESLGSKSGETPDETIRRYLSTSFFKDHLQTYKRRPIYWCFSSGKQKAFEALVYLHRYHEGTLARMRMEYVVPLQGKMAARIDRLVDDIASASTTAQAKRLQKERDKLTRQLDELRRYDEQLRHYADQRIALDLDDGVKVNYAKFGDLLAEVKAVTGTSAE
ncbi:BREX-1 system adenine-specific DNA-methyltransferase PglX [uncultured Thiodictyon sp.]|jgi:type II restriction/modification system DNA methylase subunit YeeA|uniref:BREX-1 system adenine-specific DNA-methyltransferase PglX n=1 Tax=uncultured Thiodictyon sp. TaxID=1846217 RepID=UPI0025F18FDF|nr:BREX-1 system adenine-specific DNA-methyltransferase PglX [uncultured Thiodictyon sp.]